MITVSKNIANTVPGIAYPIPAIKEVTCITKPLFHLFDKDISNEKIIARNAAIAPKPKVLRVRNNKSSSKLWGIWSIFRTTHIRGTPNEKKAGRVQIIIAEIDLIPFNSHPCELLVEGFSLQRLDFFLENFSINIKEKTIPGFTKNSMFPLLWKSSGLEIDELVAKLIEYSL